MCTNNRKNPHSKKGCECGCCERRREYERQRYANDPEFRERLRKRHRELQRERYANDPELRERVRKRHRKRQRERYANDPEFRERVRERKRQNRAHLDAQIANNQQLNQLAQEFGHNQED